VLASAADDELAGQQLETVCSKKAKRARNRADSAENQEIPQLQQRQPLRTQTLQRDKGVIFWFLDNQQTVAASLLHRYAKRRLFLH